MISPRLTLASFVFRRKVPQELCAVGSVFVLWANSIIGWYYSLGCLFLKKMVLYQLIQVKTYIYSVALESIDTGKICVKSIRFSN